MSDGKNGYVCPQCGAEYEAPGVCETCQVTLQAPDEDDELEGFQVDEEEEDSEEEGMNEEDFMEDDADTAVQDTFTTDSFEDQDNY
ncbi:MAG: hypothetical protein AAB416_01050 [Patescibacteria group bacterium]